MIYGTTEAIILRWPKALEQPAKPSIRKRLSWLSLPIWLLRLCAEMVGWLALFGFITQF